jgi:hypothetical protein
MIVNGRIFYITRRPGSAERIEGEIDEGSGERGNTRVKRSVREAMEKVDKFCWLTTEEHKTRQLIGKREREG